jgi:hypothetical protein
MLIPPAKGFSGAFTGAAGIPASAHAIHTLQVLVELDEELDEDGRPYSY